MGSSEGLAEKEMQSYLKLELTAAGPFDKKNKKYSCEAKLVAGGSYKFPITYESLLGDDGQQVVELKGINENTLAIIKSALTDRIKKGKATINETGKNEALSQAKQVSASDISGTWRGSNVDMTIKPLPKGFDIGLVVSSLSRCTGGDISGSGTLSNNIMRLTKIDNDQTCTVTINFVGDTANISEDNCLSFHGAACGFAGTLQKAR